MLQKKLVSVQKRIQESGHIEKHLFATEKLKNVRSCLKRLILDVTKFFGSALEIV